MDFITARSGSWALGTFKLADDSLTWVMQSATYPNTIYIAGDVSASIASPLGVGGSGPNAGGVFTVSSCWYDMENDRTVIETSETVQDDTGGSTIYWTALPNYGNGDTASVNSGDAIDSIGGEITVNDGTITQASYNVIANSGSIGWLDAGAVCTTNMDTGLISDVGNTASVTKNNGTIGTIYSGGFCVENAGGGVVEHVSGGGVDVNYGCVLHLYQGAVVSNYGSVVFNDVEGSVTTNRASGLIGKNLGNVTTNFGTIAADFAGESGTVLYDLRNLLAANIKDGVTIGGVLGTYEGGGGGTVPAASDVRYGVAVGETTGTCYVPSAADVRHGVNVDATTGTCYVPTAAQVLLGVSIDATTGTVRQAATYDVRDGVAYGPSDALEGTLLSTDPGEANVWDGVEYKINSAAKTGSKRASSITNCAAENIKAGVTIDDVFGTYTGPAAGTICFGGSFSVR